MPTFLVLLLMLGCGGGSATIPRGPTGAASGVMTAYTDLTAFENASPDPLTVVDFDADPDGVVISAPNPGVLAIAYYKAYEILFSAGVILGDPSQPFFGTSAPNTIGDGDINTPTPALVDVTFIMPAHQVGIMNIGGEAELRVFDVTGALIGSVRSDANEETKDFVGLVSSVPIYRMEYDFVSGRSFGGDDLVFRRSGTALASAGEVTTTSIPVGSTSTTSGVSLPAGPSGTSHSGGGTGPGPAPTVAATTATTAPAPPPTLRVDNYDPGTPGLRWGGSWSSMPNPAGEGGAQAYYADYAGSSLKFSFYGTRFGLQWGLGPSLGIMRITVDGQFLVDEDCYRGDETFTHAWLGGELALGHHTVFIECIGDSNPASGGKGIWIGSILIEGDLE